MAEKNRIKLRSTGTKKDGKSTGYFKTTKKNRKADKLKKKCFDPRAYNPTTGKIGMHVLFEEAKLK